MNEKALIVSELCKDYGRSRVVDRVSFSVCRGEIVGLLGPNGAGKTTTINMILGVLKETAGSIEINGYDIAKQRCQALKHTNFAASYAPLPGNLTLFQNLMVFGMLYGVNNLSDRIDEVLNQLDLQSFRNTRCGVLSSGEQSRASLAKAIFNRPYLLLLDEPTASLDPATAGEIRKKIRMFSAENNTAVLWTSHNMYEVEEVCDRVLFMSHGKVFIEGDPKTLPSEQGKESLEELFISIVREPLSIAVDKI